MLLSIVIPTINRYNDLCNTLNDLNEQTLKDFEVLIIDQTPNNVPIFAFANLEIKYVWLREPSASKARNIGLLKAVGDIVLFLDDDVIIRNKEFLNNHINQYLHNNAVGVAGAILTPNQGFRPSRHKWAMKKDVGWLFFPINYDKPCFIDSAWAGNFSVIRRNAIQIGGMDERFEKGAFREEADFCYRYYKTFGAFNFEPSAYLIHIGSSTGGIRSFNQKQRTKAQQHYVGQFYFLLKNVPVRDYFYHFVSGYFYFIHKKVKLYNLPEIVFEIKKCIKGFIEAKRKLKLGPQYLKKN